LIVRTFVCAPLYAYMYHKAANTLNSNHTAHTNNFSDQPPPKGLLTIFI
jgi:hypothetical protein